MQNTICVFFFFPNHLIHLLILLKEEHTWYHLKFSWLLWELRIECRLVVCFLLAILFKKADNIHRRWNRCYIEHELIIKSYLWFKLQIQYQLEMHLSFKMLCIRFCLLRITLDAVLHSLHRYTYTVLCYSE